jgi:ABC-2 type transport system permease protein
MNTIANIVAVTRREFRTRAMSRTFVVATALLVVGVVAIALAPVIIRYVDRTDTQRIAVWTGARDLAVDPAASISVLLNPPAALGTPAPSAPPDFAVTAVTDLADARAAVTRGEFAAVLGIERGASGDLAFTLYTNEGASGPVPALIRQATTTIAISDRLARLGVAPASQAGVFQPAPYQVMWPDPNRSEAPRSLSDETARGLLGFGMTVLVYMMIIMYGNWVASSVVEEKSSRVMEVILNAATPFQLLAGKVLGVGAVALLQYGAVLVAGSIALAVQPSVASAVLGTGPSALSLPAGLTFGMLAMLFVYGVLGFLLYAVLFAAAGSIVSRQEDVNTVVMPLTLICTLGYFVGVYAGIGLLDIRSAWMPLLSQVPFLSPFMMLSRITAGGVDAWELVLSVAILGVSILAALWVAARIYAVGVLLYGQRPGPRAIRRLVRSGM